MSLPAEPAELLRQGILACRRERWHEGYDLLARAARSVSRQTDLPPRLFSFLGVAMARCEGRRKEGLELCRYAVSREPREPESLLNLATVCLMLGRRKAALKALDRGLSVAPLHEELGGLRESLGRRRSPPLSFLPRTHPINVLVGRVRHGTMSRLERGRSWVDERFASLRAESEA